MRFIRSKTSASAFAAGYPETNVVQARRIRGAGNAWLRRGPVILVNGSNSFVVDPAPFKQISVESGEDGVFNIVGAASIGEGEKSILAKFGSQAAAANGYAALMRAHAGIKVAGAKGGRGVFSAFKWPAGLAALFVFVALFGAWGSDDNQAVAAGIPQLSAADVAEAQRRAIEEVAKMANAQPQGSQAGAFNRKEKSLEELANGNYSFEPKLKAPDVQVPELNCATTK